MKGKDMYFAINKNGYSGYGKTLLEAIKDLKDQDDDNLDIQSVEFFKAEKIKVELREVPTPVEVPSKTIAKKK
jgi:hypothetical protein